MKLTQKEYISYLDALVRIDRAINKLYKIDTVYKNMEQHFRVKRTRITYKLMDLVRADRKRSAK